MKKCEKLKSLKDYLNEFREFILLRNDPCDAEQNSYDAAIMLTGRTQNFADVGEGIKKFNEENIFKNIFKSFMIFFSDPVGFAIHGAVCSMYGCSS